LGVDIHPLTIPVAQESEARVRVLARALVGYLVLPNAAFATLGHFVYMARPLLNVDYLLLGAVAGLVAPAVVIGAYVILVATDAFVSLAPVFHFDPGTAAFSMPYAIRLGWGLASLAFVLVTSASAVAVLGISLSGAQRRRVRPSLLLAAVGLLTIDALGGTNVLSRGDRAIFGLNIATSALYRTTANVYGAVAARRHRDDARAVVHVRSATQEVRTLVADSGSGSANAIGAVHVVLVIVESLGRAKDSTWDLATFAPLLSEAVRRQYVVRVGTVPAHGATTSGELRELCGVAADYRRVGRVHVEDCLPARLQAVGFHTVALHGYSGAFFDRYEWYPRLGFGEVLFAESLTKMTDVALCGSTFRGVRDVDAAHIVEREILRAPKGERRFVYWLTLSSHLPVDASCAVGPILSCPEMSDERRFEDVCTLMRVQRLVVQSVADIATNPALAPTRFIVVGDHAPPYFSRIKRSLFVEQEVPFVELIPRSGPRR
jgi:Sulfatase